MASKKSGRRRRRTAGKPKRVPAEPAATESARPKCRRIGGRRLWLFRLAAVTLVPALFFLLAEVSLRVVGFGLPTSFFVPLSDRDALTTNQQFGWRFFPPAIARAPVVCELPAKKAPDTYRIFVLGGSAAMGTPDSAFAFGRILEVMLQQRLQPGKIEVVNAAMTAVNSHVVLPIARDCAQRDADLFIVYMGNNEVVGPYGSGTVFQGFSPHLSMIRASIFAKSTRLGQLLENAAHRFATPGDAPTEWRGMEMFLDHRVAADDPRMENVYSHFRANLADICDVGRDAAAKVIVCTVATDLKDTAPFASLHRADLDESQRSDWQRICKAGIALAEADQHAEAVEQFDKASEIDDHRADLHFRLARCLLALERYGEAREHFVKARDLDALRFRADTQINRIIREVAGGRQPEGVYLIDVERVFQQSDRTAHGIPGRALLYEHVHMNPEGNYLLAEAVFPKVVGLIPEEVPRNPLNSVAFPGPESYFGRIALTDWDRYQLALDVSHMEQEPPFTSQLNHAERRRLRDEELEKLRAEGTSPAALDRARGAYRVAIKGDPQDVALRRNFAALLLERGDLQEAAKQWRFLLGRFPAMAQWHVELGTVLKTQKKWTEAVAEFRQAMRLNPALAPWVYFDVGTVRMEQGKLAEAGELFHRVLAINPGMAQAHNSLGAVLLKQDKFADAVEQFRMALQHDPKLALAHHNYGYALAKQDKLSEAVEHYRQALQLDPLHLDTYRDLASVLVKQGKMPEAIEQYRQSVQVAPQNAEAHYQLGNALAACARTAEAAEAFRKVLEVTPDHVKARHNLAVALGIMGRTAEAIGQYRQVLRRKPDYLPTLNSLAAAYAETGRFDEAVACARKALQLAQSRGDAKLVLSIRHRLLLFQAGKPYRRPTRRGGV